MLIGILIFCISSVECVLAVIADEAVSARCIRSTLGVDSAAVLVEMFESSRHIHFVSSMKVAGFPMRGTEQRVIPTKSIFESPSVGQRARDDSGDYSKLADLLAVSWMLGNSGHICKANFSVIQDILLEEGF